MPLSWIIKQTDHNTIQLAGYSDKGKHLIKVKTGPNNSSCCTTLLKEGIFFSFPTPATLHLHFQIPIH